MNFNKMSVESSNEYDDAASLFSDDVSDVFFDCEEYIQSGVSSDMFLDCEEDDESDTCSIVSIEVNDEYPVCSTAEARDFFSELVNGCDSKLVTISGSGPLEPPIDQQKIAFPSCSSANCEPLSSFDDCTANVVADHILIDDVEEDYDSQRSCYSMSPVAHLCPENVSSDESSSLFSTSLSSDFSVSDLESSFEFYPTPEIVQQTFYADKYYSPLMLENESKQKENRCGVASLSGGTKQQRKPTKIKHLLSYRIWSDAIKLSQKILGYKIIIVQFLLSSQLLREVHTFQEWYGDSCIKNLFFFFQIV
ncbi:unnamed protein product [Ambrosiozyma monospora]|uniref:Unnamed protein product n=1 Tax=Ambrosiozyma monospora TaxID=43982 RepID=A0ACB5T9M3_AMBMO|nr:unnamed protein product [Ambrosiozyma monospora]